MGQFRVLYLLLSFLALSAAFSWPDASPFEGAEGAVAHRLDARQDNGDSKDSSSATSKDSSTTKDSSSAKTTGDSKDSKSKTDSKTTAKPSRTTDKSGKTTEYDPRLPPGGVSMITPAVTAGAQYYKIGNWMTLAWNYTSLSAPPKYIDVYASCSANQATYTLALNQSFQSTQKILWDTGDYQKTATVPLLTETYTLIVLDAASSISATPKAGYLGVFDQWTFGMYVPQSYTPLSGYQCATCNGAMTSMERQTLGFLIGMGTITVLTFTLFANNFGLF